MDFYANFINNTCSKFRNFSKLKLIEKYLRSTMTQDRLSSLGTLSIENDNAENLDFSALIQNFFH